MWMFKQQEHRFLLLRFCSPADLLCTHVEQDIGGCQTKSHTIDEQGTGVGDQSDTLQSIEEKKQIILKWF